jgi:hypothetical protein
MKKSDALWLVVFAALGYIFWPKIRALFTSAGQLPTL